MKIFSKVIVACLIVIINVTRSSSYCDIVFPKPDVSYSKNFDIFTNNGKQRFTQLGSYIPGKTYDITVSINEMPKDQHLKIKEIYVMVNDVNIENEASDDNNWRNGGDIMFNVTHASKTEYCVQRAFVHYLYTQPHHVTFYWTMPKKEGICLRIVIILKMTNSNDETFIEERSHTICDQAKSSLNQMQSDQAETSSCLLKSKPDPVKKCNMKSTAVYRMTIENKWNSVNHWKDWPGKDGHAPKLTPYIGASHSNDFNIYHMGGMASRGVLQVCSNGSYNELQQHFYSAGTGIMTVILARSLEALPQKKKSSRSALIVVNATSHLVSFLSRLDPSPDWCTGLSRYDLCAGQCSWPEKVSIPLYPWDAGINNGETYLSSYKDIASQSPICPITSSWPKDNPFTVLNGEIQNIGVVTFNLIQEYNKQANQMCMSYNSVKQDESYSNDAIPKAPYFSYLKSNPDKMRHCVMTSWTDWSSCSTSCGKGERVRYRKLLKGKPEKCVDSAQKDVEICSQNCPKSSSLETCSWRLWATWSPCNATCSQPGVMYRERVFINKQEKKECMEHPGMRSIQSCRQSNVRCNSQIVCKDYVNIGDLCIWSNPTQRFYYDFSSGDCKAFLYKGCYGGLNNFHTYEECNSFCNSQQKDFPIYRSNAPVISANRCNGPMTWGEFCDTEYSSTRWYFDKINRKCYSFLFRGCRGNANSFNTKSECEDICLATTTIQTSSISDSKSTKPNCLYSQWSEWSFCDDDCQKPQSRFRSLIEKNDNCNEESTEVRKCQSEKCKLPKTEIGRLRPCKYSNWSEWTKCSSSCGQGVKERRRKKLSYNCKPQFPQFTERESCYNDCAFY